MKTKKTKYFILLFVVLFMVILSIPFVIHSYDSRPSVIISSDATNLTTEGTVNITITFSEKVYGLGPEDIVFGGTNFEIRLFKNIDWQTYIFTLVSLTDNTVTIDIPEGIVGNKATPSQTNSAAKQFSITFDSNVITYPVTGGNLLFEQNTGTIIASSESINGNLVIPAEINGIKVEHITEQTFTRRSITSLVLPEGLKSIGEEAFAYCHELESVNIPSTLTEIGNSAFNSCSKLKNIVLADGLKILGDLMFYQCLELETIDIPGSITKIPYACFCLCAKFKNVVFNEGITEIGGSAFELCCALENVCLPTTVTTIGKEAFRDCDLMKQIILPKNLIEIGAGAFKSSGIESIVMPNNIENITEETFSFCVKLKSITLPNNIKSIGAYAFSNCTFSEIIITENVTFIGHDAFHGCTNLTSIYFMGNAPTFEITTTIYNNYYCWAKVYYILGATGFSDTLGGHQTALGQIKGPVYGDVNGDSETNPMDATILNRYNALWPTYTSRAYIIEANCDLNNDGNINPLDGTILARHNANWSSYISLPWGKNA